MKIGRDVFINSAVFGILVAVTYWFSSRHPGGTLLLAFMAAAMSFLATYIYVSLRGARLGGDAPALTPAQAAGEHLGTFTTRTIWPALAAGALFLFIIGVLWSPFVAVFGFLALLLILWRLGAESNREA